MPERQPDDGPLGVDRPHGQDGYLRFKHGDQWMVLSEYNAARLFGMLALFLNIPLPSALGKAIKLTKPGDDELNASFGFPEAKTLGDKVAQHLIGEALQNRVSRCNAFHPDSDVQSCALIKGHEGPHSLFGEFCAGMSVGPMLACVHGASPPACQEPECRGVAGNKRRRQRAEAK